MKILYLSCHEILEYDELKLFAELGHEVYSHGAYTMPGGDEGRKRPPLKLPYNPHFIELALQYPKENLHPEMLEGIDMVMVMHEPKYITANWPLLKEFIGKGGRVVWRSIGQSIPHVERQLAPMRAEGLQIVRYSPEEQTIAGNIGLDAMIPFYKDPAEYDGWNGSQMQAINFTQSLMQRGQFCGYMTIKRVMTAMPFKVYGPGNEDLGAWHGGLLSYEDQRQALRDNRVYFYAGTYPASYTLSLIEAMMTGIPVVAVGPRLGNGPMFPEQQTYAIPNIITHGANGYFSDNDQQLRRHVKELLNDHELAKHIGLHGRMRAIELFGKDKVARLWADFFGGEKENQNQKANQS